VDIVINNAGVAITGLTFEELEIEDFDWISLSILWV
jgi:NADP-dependent 3-hydroxy acid dehydrogenase YdfG